MNKEKAVNVRKTSKNEVAKKPKNASRPNISRVNIPLEERLKMIAIAAYHKAEKRGFEPDGELQEWAEAEQEIDELMSR